MDEMTMQMPRNIMDVQRWKIGSQLSVRVQLDDVRVRSPDPMAEGMLVRPSGVGVRQGSVKNGTYLSQFTLKSFLVK